MKRFTFFKTVELNIIIKYCRRAYAAIFILLLMVVLAGSARAQSSSYAGRYSGEWVAKYTGLAVGQEEHVGTWNISIASDGEVTGVEFDKTGGDKAGLKGFIDEDGYIKVFVKYDSGTYTIKGVLEKKGTRLTGTLKQMCSSGTSVCVNIEIILNRNQVLF